MSLKNVCMAECLRGHGFAQRKRVLLEQIWQPGRLMEGLFSPSGSSCFMARFDFHSRGVKVGAAPRLSRGVLLCRSLLPFQRECLCLVDIAASPYGPLLPLSCFTPLHQPRFSCCCGLSAARISFPLGFEAWATTGSSGSSHRLQPSTTRAWFGRFHNPSRISR